jgi:uncharacterized protein YukE
MMRDSDPSVNNPYSDQTYKNTTVEWVSDSTPVDVDLEGLRQYAKKMSSASANLMSQQGHLSHLMQMPLQAWEGSTLGEAEFVRQQMMANASELFSYLGVLGVTLMNIGNAAQTVADIYDSADGTSAASLNDVLFAFGDPTVRRPANLPKNLGETYDQRVLAEQEKAKNPPPVDESQWQAPTQRIISPYETVMTSNGPNGQRREVATTASPYGGPVVVTTTVYNAKGKVTSETSTRTYESYDYTKNVATQTVETYTGQKLNGKSVTETHYSTTTGEVVKTTTTNSDADGKATGGRAETTDQKTGEQTEDTTAVKKGKTVVTDEVVVGKATPGGQTIEPSIAQAYDPTFHQAG